MCVWGGVIKEKELFPHWEKVKKNSLIFILQYLQTRGNKLKIKISLIL